MTIRLVARVVLITAIALTLFVSVVPSYAAPIQCTAIESNGSVALTLLLAGGADAAGCEVGDKIFSGLTYSGSNAASTVFVTFDTNGAIPTQVTIQFGDNTAWSSLGLTYNTTVDTTLCPQCVIVNSLDAIFTPPTPNDVAGTFSHSPAGSPNPVNVNGLTPANETAQAAFSPYATAVSTTFTQTGGTQLDEVETSFSQTNLPEPATFAMLGGGLLLLALLRRKLS
jgi:hypothetical protein